MPDFSNIDYSLIRELPADAETENFRRQVKQASYSFVEPVEPSNPKLLHVSDCMLESLNLSNEFADSKDFLELFSGVASLPETRPFSMNYGGHQFGYWAGQLGDGRAINLFEVVENNERWTLQLKGAGETPYSRSADGLAVLRSSIREHLCSEAMFHLGVPTTRSLCLIETGDKVLRDMMYDGNPEYEKGAIVCRVAPTFLRFGNYQIHAAREEKALLQKLIDYTIDFFFPQIQSSGNQRIIEFFEEVVSLTRKMIIHWQRVGFVHGVMNTDNMSILGLTIDYGPYGFIDNYDENWTPNTTDRSEKRYRFGYQPMVALWNLVQLANVLCYLTEDVHPFQGILDSYNQKFQVEYLQMMRAKLGLSGEDSQDESLITALRINLQLIETDMTIFFRELSKFSSQSKPENLIDLVKEAFYDSGQLSENVLEQWQSWAKDYLNRLKQNSFSQEGRIQLMNQTNPKYILRNYMAQIAIDAANEGDVSIIKELYQLLKKPYDEQVAYHKWYKKRPDWAKHKVGCSMLSCSS